MLYIKEFCFMLKKDTLLYREMLDFIQKCLKLQVKYKELRVCTTHPSSKQYKSL